MQNRITQQDPKQIINQTLDDISQSTRALMEMPPGGPEYDRCTQTFYNQMTPKVKTITDICAEYERTHPTNETSFADSLVTSGTLDGTGVKLKCSRDSIVIFAPIPPKTEKPFHGYDTALLGYAEEQKIPQFNHYCIHIVHCYARQRSGGKIRDVDNNDTGFIHVLDSFFQPGAKIEKLYEAWQSSTTLADEGTYIYIASSFAFLNKPNALVRAVRGGLNHAL